MTDLVRRCDLCNTAQEEIYAVADGDGERRVVRAGWICWACWPAEGSWHKAILRERTVSKQGDLEKQG